METSAIFLLKLSKLMDRFNDLENEISNRGQKMDETEARIFQDNLDKLYEKLVAKESELETRLANTSLDLLSTKLTELQPYHLKVIILRTKFSKIVSSSSPGNANYASNQNLNSQGIYNPIPHHPAVIQSPSGPPHIPYTATGSQINQLRYPQNPYNQPLYSQVVPNQILRPPSVFNQSLPQAASNKTPQSQVVSKLDSRNQYQSFLIKRLESIEIPEGISSVEAEILHSQFASLYSLFFANQLNIEAVIDEAGLKNQQKIASEFYQKVIEAQTKLKKIITPNEKIPQTAQTDTTPNLHALIKKSESLLQQMASLEPTGQIDAKKAEILNQHLTSLYDSFTCTQNEIETHLSGALLDDQREISKKTLLKVIDLQTKLKNISTPTAPSLTPPPPEVAELSSKLITLQSELDDLSDLRVQFYELFEMMSDLSKQTPNCRDTDTTRKQHLEIAKDIQSKVNFLQTKLNEIKLDKPQGTSNPHLEFSHTKAALASFTSPSYNVDPFLKRPPTLQSCPIPPPPPLPGFFPDGLPSFVSSSNFPSSTIPSNFNYSIIDA